jgi:hypothetical protein
MKKSAISLILWLFCFSVYCQQYHPLPDSNVVWTVRTERFWSDTSPYGKYDYWTEIYVLKGDTIKNGKTYKKCYVTLDSAAQNSLTLVAIMRSDSTKKKYFGFRTPITNTATEQLFYDFSVKTGDVIQISFPDFSGNLIEIKAVKEDSIQIFTGEYRRRIKFQQNNAPSWWNNEYWVEGVGSLAGLFYAGIPLGQVADIGYPWLICESENGIVKYSNSEKCYYPPVKYVDIKKLEKNTALLFPNPIKTSIYISEIQDGSLLDLLNLQGEVVCTKQDGTKGRLPVIMDVENLPGGCYVLRVTSKESMHFYRILKE